MKLIPIDTRSLFKPLQAKLISLLHSLKPSDWQKQTVAKEWKVKDVVSHILDGQLRVLSIQRDKYFGEQAPKSNQHKDVVQWLNQLNKDWVLATKRLSPPTLIFLLESISELVTAYYQSLDPWEEAIFPVSWAGETSSLNWMHLAREYTEYWHHQQQIRAAVNKPGIMTHEFFYPVLDTFFLALPHTFRNIDAEQGTIIEAKVSGDAGGSWFLVRKEGAWKLSKQVETLSTASVHIPLDLSWILFSKSIRSEKVLDQVELKGDLDLAKQVLEMVSVMA
ncbi:MAG: maleylpyruvate isomerase N-terminal domain-containing protein [Bacteroidota bacterium]